MQEKLPLICHFYKGRLKNSCGLQGKTKKRFNFSQNCRTQKSGYREGIYFHKGLLKKNASAGGISKILQNDSQCT
jgi:hypothetical protein